MARTIKTTVYNVHQLGEHAKENAREWYIHDVLSNSAVWYDQVFDDFEEICGIVGITVLKRTQTCRIDNRNITRPQRCIWFSGFASQGDGACFEGSWRHAPRASRRIREYAPQDKKLHAITDALTKVQKRNFYQLGAMMTHNGPYMHEYCMNVDIERESEHGQEPTEDSFDTVTETMRELARWLYRSLEAAWISETADDIVDDQIHANEWAFTANGTHFAA